MIFFIFLRLEEAFIKPFDVIFDFFIAFSKFIHFKSDIFD